MMDEIGESFSKDTWIWQLKAERDALASMLKDVQKECIELRQENDRLRKLYKETCEEKNKEIFEWIEHSKQLVLNSLPWQEENARLREMVKYFACHCGGTCDRSDENCLISQAALGKKSDD